MAITKSGWLSDFSQNHSLSSFTTALIVKPLDDGLYWEIVEPFDYDIGDLGGEKLTVPAGFITDFASVPRIFWNIFPPWGMYGKAAVLHDWLYHVQIYTRRKCDQIFLEAMEVLKVPRLKRWTIYLVVRSGGWSAWNQHKVKNIQPRREN